MADDKTQLSQPQALALSTLVDNDAFVLAPSHVTALGILCGMPISAYVPIADFAALLADGLVEEETAIPQINAMVHSTPASQSSPQQRRFRISSKGRAALFGETGPVDPMPGLSAGHGRVTEEGLHDD